jgi:NADH dehydrogenase
MAEVQGVDTARKTLKLKGANDLSYDYLVLATGASHSYFGREEWAPLAPGLKSVGDATEIRRRILRAFESAELQADPELNGDPKLAREWLTFAIVGGGPTGVEIAGSIGEMARFALKRDFRHIDTRNARIILIEAHDRVLSGFPPSLSERAAGKLARLGVEVRTGSRVEEIQKDGVMVAGEKIPAHTVIWAAGVVASPAGRWLSAEMDRAGRVKVAPDLSVPGHPEIFVIGDTATLEQDGQSLPGVASVALQQGKYVGKLISRRLAGKSDPAPFRYLNKGNLATVGRTFAVADIHGLKLSGFIGWVVWVFVHIYYLIGFRNRLIVLTEWALAYLTFRRGARLITDR